jgi:hypothetical protein
MHVAGASALNVFGAKNEMKHIEPRPLADPI